MQKTHTQTLAASLAGGVHGAHSPNPLLLIYLAAHTPRSAELNLVVVVVVVSVVGVVVVVVVRVT